MLIYRNVPKVTLSQSLNLQCLPNHSDALASLPLPPPPIASPSADKNKYRYGKVHNEAEFQKYIKRSCPRIGLPKSSGHTGKCKHVDLIRYLLTSHEADTLRA